MSAFSKLKYYARKPVALIMAASLVTSTVPAVSLVQAAPAFAVPAASDYEETTGGKFDTSTGEIQIMFDSADKKDGSGSVDITKDGVMQLLQEQKKADLDALFTYTKGGTDEFSKTVDAKLDELAEADNEHADATYAVVDGTVEYKITDIEVTIEAADNGKAEIKETEDGWTVSADEAISNEALVVTISSITYQYKFDYTCTYTEDDQEGEESGNQEGTGSEGQEGTGESGEQGGSTNPEPSTATEEGTYPEKGFSDDAKGELTKGLPAVDMKVTAVDYWEDATTSATTVELEGSLVYQGEPITGTILENQPKNITCTVELGEAADYISASVERKDGDGFLWWKKYDYVVTVEPKHASTEPLSFTVNVESENGNYTVTVKVPAVSPKTFDLSEITTDPVDFRMAGDQGRYIVDAANAAVEEQTGVEGLFSSAEVTDTDRYYAQANEGMTLDASSYQMKVNEDAEGAEDYIFTTTNEGGASTQKLPKVPVNPMETENWSEPENAELASKLSITGDSLKDNKTLTEDEVDPNDGTWFHTDVTVAWEGGAVADGAKALSATTSFDSTATLSAQAQGVQTGSFFVKDDDDIVRRIENVQYLYDSVAPGLSAFEAVPKGRDYKSTDKEIWAAEEMSVQFITNEGAANSEKSGINRVDAYYTEQGSSKSEESKDLQDMDPASTANDAYTYKFDILADSKVSTDSIKVNLQDKAGNESGDLGYKNATTNIDVANLVAQATAPTISVSWDTSNAHNGSYYNTNRTLTLTVNAPFFEYTQQYLANHTMATITKDGSGWKTVTPGDFTKTGDDTWTCTISFTEDGDYEVSGVNATDVLGRTNTAAGDTFTIDKTDPRMQVTFDNNNAANGMYYNAARTATITITEHNFDPSLVNITPTANGGNGTEVGQPSISSWSSNGDVHTATVTFPGQGVYTLSVDGMDLATNELTAYTCPEFVVDTLTPEITISDVANMTAYADSVSPSVQVHDTNLDSATDIHVEVVGTSPYGQQANPFTTQPSMTATDAAVSYGNPAELRANDNVYTVVVHAIDLAGNTSDDALTFSVNRFGSTYVISDETGEMLNEYLKFDDTTDVRVTEINPSGLDTSKTAVELTRDTSNSTLTGDDYTTEHGSATGWQEYTYTVSRDNYDSDGVYRVLFHSQDAAGNISENEMEGKNAADVNASAQVNFAVDDTAPLATFADLSNAEPYNESSHVAKVTFEDNLMLDHAVIEINGEEVATFDADALAQSATQEFTINELAGSQNIQVRVWDAAGNEGEASMDNVVVTTNPFELWRRNTPLFAATIAVAVLAAAGIIFAVVKKRSKDDEEGANA